MFLHHLELLAIASMWLVFGVVALAICGTVGSVIAAIVMSMRE